MEDATTVFIALRAKAGANSEEVRHWLAAEFDANCGAYSLFVADTNNPLGIADPACDGLIHCSRQQAPALLDRIASNDKVEYATLQVNSVEYRNDLNRQPGSTTPGASLIALWVAKAGLSDTAVQDYWRRHAPLALKVHHGAARYVQYPVRSQQDTQKPYWGLALLQFPDMATMAEGLYRCPEDIALIDADVAQFINDTDILVAREHVCQLPGTSP